MNQQHELSQTAARRLERMEQWLEDHEERLEKVEARPIQDSTDQAKVFLSLSSTLFRESRRARNEQRMDAAAAFNLAADLVLAATDETLMEDVMTKLSAIDDSDVSGQHPTY